MENTILEILEQHRISGILKEEYLDHYLSYYEQLLAEGMSIEQARQKTTASIDIKDLKKGNQRIFFLQHQSKINLAMAALILILVFSFFQSSEQNPSIQAMDVTTVVQSDSLKFGKLLDGPAVVVAGFGMRSHKLVKAQFHKGIDLRAETGASVYSPIYGIVEKVGFNHKRGKFIELIHADGFTTRYYHLSAINVREGEAISLGQKIGEVGSSGMALGPHLHFELYKRESLLDPATYLKV